MLAVTLQLTRCAILVTAHHTLPVVYKVSGTQIVVAFVAVAVAVAAAAILFIFLPCGFLTIWCCWRWCRCRCRCRNGLLLLLLLLMHAPFRRQQQGGQPIPGGGGLVARSTTFKVETESRVYSEVRSMARLPLLALTVSQIPVLPFPSNCLLADTTVCV